MLKSFFKFLFQYLKTFRFLWGLSVVLNIITFFAIFSKIKPEDEIVALKYNILSGVEWYGNGFNIYLLPTSALIIIVINYLLYLKLKKYPGFLNFLTVFASLAVQIITLIAVVLLIRIN